MTDTPATGARCPRVPRADDRLTVLAMAPGSGRARPVPTAKGAAAPAPAAYRNGGGARTDTSVAPGLPARRRLGLGDPVTALLVAPCLGFVLVAVFAPLIAPWPRNKTDILNASTPLSAAHWLGTDDTGRDILSRLVFGFRLSLLGPTVGIATAAMLAIALSLSAVWIGGRHDRIIARVLNLLFAFPALRPLEGHLTACHPAEELHGAMDYPAGEGGQ